MTPPFVSDSLVPFNTTNTATNSPQVQSLISFKIIFPSQSRTLSITILKIIPYGFGF